MTVHLITGAKGENHITSANVGSLLAGTITQGCVALQTYNGDKPFRFGVVTGADKDTQITVYEGNGIMYGRHFAIEEQETLYITPPSTGYQRIDYICIKYTKAKDNTESASLVVLQGKAVTTDPKVPSVPTGNIAAGATTAYFPLHRVEFTGATSGTAGVTPIFSTHSPSQDVYTERFDSPSGGSLLILCKNGIGMAQFQDWPVGSTEAWESQAVGNGTKAYELPEVYRPSYWVTCAVDVSNLDAGHCRMSLSGGTFSYMFTTGASSASGDAAINGCLTWMYGTGEI